MADDSIKISLDEVKKAADSIRRINQNLTDRLTDITKEMNILESTWQSDASSTIRSNFNALAPRFEEYRKIVDSYAKFLENTAQSYNDAETAINSNASAFK